MLTLLLCAAMPWLLYLWFNNLHTTKYAVKLPQLKTWKLLLFGKLIRNLYRTDRIAPAMCYAFEQYCGVVHLLREKKIAVTWLAFRPSVLFFHPESIEVILNNSSALEKSVEYKYLHPWLGSGLLTSAGEKWKTRRRLLTPAFHFRVLEEFVPVFNEQSQILVNKMKGLLDKEWVDIRSLITLCTLDIICETAMGAKINAQHHSDSDYVKAVYEIGDVFFYRIAIPWYWWDWMFHLFPRGKEYLKNLEIVHNLTRKVIREKKESLLLEKTRESPRTESSQDGLFRRKAFLELLLEHHLDDPSFTEEDIREEVDTFMFEGHDTTATAISWTLYNIGLRPDVQENIFRELEEIFGSDQERPVTSDDIRAMRYLECVIKESLRLYPSVPAIGRYVKEDIDVLGYTVPSGIVCSILPYMLHRDPEIYKNPEVFDPARFFPENSIGRHPYAYIPFSAGPRNCIGQRFALMEEKTVIANILRNFKVKALDPRDKILIPFNLILQSSKPLRLQIEPRGCTDVH